MGDRGGRLNLYGMALLTRQTTTTFVDGRITCTVAVTATVAATATVAFTVVTTAFTFIGTAPTLTSRAALDTFIAAVTATTTATTTTIKLILTTTNSTAPPPHLSQPNLLLLDLQRLSSPVHITV